MEKVYYGRVSTKKDEQDSSIVNQKEYFKEKGIKKGYIDRSSGTTIDKRVEFQKLLQDCGLDIKKIKSGTKYKSVVVDSNRKSNIKYIYTKSISRFARNVSECLEIARMLRNKGVYVVFEDINKSTEDESFFLTMGIMATMAESESREKSRSIKMGASMSAKAGVVRSWSAYGYSYNKEENTLIAIPEEAEVIKTIFKLKLEGFGGRKIANELNSLGYKTRNNKNWLPNVVNRIVKNPIYTGLTTRNRYDTNKLFGNNNHRLKDEEEWITIDNDKVEPIISKEIFGKCQEVRKKATHESSKTGVWKGRGEFASKIICSKCNQYYTRNKDTKIRDYGKYERVFFNCSTKKRLGKNACDSRNVTTEEIEKLLNIYVGEGKYKKVCSNFINKIIIPNTEKHINDLKSSINKDNKVQIEINKNKIKELKEQLGKLLDLYLINKISTDILDSRKIPIEKEIEKLEKINNKLCESEVEILSKIKKIEDIKIQAIEFEKKIPTYIYREDFIDNYLVAIVVKNNGMLMPVTKIHAMMSILNNIVNGIFNNSKDIDVKKIVDMTFEM